MLHNNAESLAGGDGSVLPVCELSAENVNRAELAADAHLMIRD